MRSCTQMAQSGWPGRQAVQRAHGNGAGASTGGDFHPTRFRAAPKTEGLYDSWYGADRSCTTPTSFAVSGKKPSPGLHAPDCSSVPAC